MKALVLDGAFKGSICELMARSNFTMAKDINEADIVVFTGGSDVDPSLYGEKNVSSSCTPSRDKYETDIFAKALDNDLLMFGICRGFQHLAVMNGGRLWQHVNNHGSSHDIVDADTGLLVKATSIHHQMVRQTGDMNILAVTNGLVASNYKRAEEEITIYNHKSDENDPLEIEAACWIETKSFGVQGHPELIESSPEFSSWTMFKLEEFMYELAKMQGLDSPFLDTWPRFLTNSLN